MCYQPNIVPGPSISGFLKSLESQNEFGPQIVSNIPDLNSPSTLIWCNFTSDCGTTTEGNGTVEQKRTLDRIFQRITMKPGQSMKIKFPQVLKIYRKVLNVEMEFRKGPVIAGTPGKQTLAIELQYYNYPGYGTYSAIDDDRAEWASFEATSDGWPPQAEVSIIKFRF
ncbi:hypothetical protein GQR58_028707 [Nymphon striatum]|nr:hypothetical protein GQR58_028707 [Nymphon striatum]